MTHRGPFQPRTFCESQQKQGSYGRQFLPSSPVASPRWNEEKTSSVGTHRLLEDTRPRAAFGLRRGSAREKNENSVEKMELWAHGRAQVAGSSARSSTSGAWAPSCGGNDELLVLFHQPCLGRSAPACGSWWPGCHGVGTTAPRRQWLRGQGQDNLATGSGGLRWLPGLGLRGCANGGTEEKRLAGRVVPRSASLSQHSFVTAVARVFSSRNGQTVFSGCGKPEQGEDEAAQTPGAGSGEETLPIPMSPQPSRGSCCLLPTPGKRQESVSCAPKEQNLALNVLLMYFLCMQIRFNFWTRSSLQISFIGALYY